MKGPNNVKKRCKLNKRNESTDGLHSVLNGDMDVRTIDVGVPISQAFDKFRRELGLESQSGPTRPEAMSADLSWIQIQFDSQTFKKRVKLG